MTSFKSLHFYGVHCIPAKALWAQSLFLLHACFQDTGRELVVEMGGGGGEWGGWVRRRRGVRPDLEKAATEGSCANSRGP